MNGALLGAILCVIFLTGIFSVPADAGNTAPDLNSVETAVEESEANRSTSVNMEFYRVEGKTFDPYLLNVVCCGTVTGQVSGTSVSEDGKTPELLSLRGESSVRIVSKNSGEAITCGDLAVGDLLMVFRDGNSNEIVGVVTVANTTQGKEVAL